MKFVYNQDIFSVSEDTYIINTCDCTSLYPYGFSVQIEEKFPNSTPFNYRRENRKKSIPGTIFIIRSDIKSPTFINIFDSVCFLISEENQHNYFEQGLNALIDYFEGTSKTVKIAVPAVLVNNLEYQASITGFEKSLKDLGIQIEITIFN